MSASAKTSRNVTPLIPDAVSTFLARAALAGFVVVLLAMAGHA